MFKLIVSMAVLAGALTLAGCATHPCRDALSYREATAHEPPVTPDGVKPLTPDPAFQIPQGEISKAGPKARNACVVLPPQVIDPNNPPKNAG
ncbi:MAG TPA: hypothetical protein VFH85_04210 [Gammaproteobacteria bacterium]|nr:hypothetical protein [Gammaproteobacteria bacterium]